MKTLINFGILCMLVVAVVIMSGGTFETLKGTFGIVTLKAIDVINVSTEKLDAYNEKLDRDYEQSQKDWAEWKKQAEEIQRIRDLETKNQRN